MTPSSPSPSQLKTHQDNKNEIINLTVEIGVTPIAFSVIPPTFNDIFRYRDNLKRLEYLKLTYGTLSN